jgi:hypothetical protein
VYILGMKSSRWIMVVMGLALGFTLGQWRSEHKRRVAAEARYEYDFNGVLEVGKIPPRAAWPACGYCDSLVGVDPKTMDTLGYFTWRDSVWHTSYKPKAKDSVPILTVGPESNWVSGVVRPVTHTIEGKKVKRFLVEAFFDGGLYQVFAPTQKEAFRMMDSVSLEITGRHCCVQSKG